MKNIALITGASSGLGKEFVRQIVQRGAPNEIWVIARRKERLLELVHAFPCTIVPIPLDLTEAASYTLLEERLQKEQPHIEYLVCAAGMGRIGLTEQTSAQDTDRMIELNCRALARVTQACLPYMHAGSKILEIASVAGFHPLPAFNLYAATKAFVLSYTKTLHFECRKKGIHVTAVCPYWVKDTEFIPTASTADNAGFRHFPFAQKTEDVVRRALDSSENNVCVCTPGIVPTVDRILAKTLPHGLMMRGLDIFRRL